MEQQVTEMVIIPDGAPYGLHIVYNYDEDMGSPKGFRTVFTPEQVAALEAEFQQTKYITGAQKKQLAARLKIQEKQVKDWFQNRRSKARREGESLNDNVQPPLPQQQQQQQQKRYVEQQQQQQKTRDNEEGICHILEFLQDQQSDIEDMRLNHSLWDLDETLEVLKKHCETISFEENTPLPIKRQRCEILDDEEPSNVQRFQIFDDQQPSKRQRLEILDHQIYDPATGVWRRVA